MKRNAYRGWAFACLCVTIPLTLAQECRTDINPALLYWQAFAVMPDLPDPDQKYLFETDWRTRPMDERAGQLAAKYDSTFRLLRQAVVAKVPCDWGIDMTQGPYALLPHLAKAKRCAQAATLRGRWAVQNNRQEAAREDLAAAFVMGRNLARDQVLISALVQIAIESILTGHVTQQWAVLRTETIGALLNDFDHAPARRTMAECMRTEKAALYEWLLHKVESIRAEYPNNEQAALTVIASMLSDIASEDSQKRSTLGADVLEATGHSVARLVASVQELAPFYDELEKVMALPYAEFQPALDNVNSRVAAHPNLILHEFFPAVLKVRLKEFRVIARFALLRAAYQRRLDPVGGLARVTDPFGSGPFEYSRFKLEGVDRGFKLQSELRVPDFNEVLIFAETPGPAFYIDGPPAGQKIH